MRGGGVCVSHLLSVEQGAIFNVSVMHEIVFMICIIE